MGLEKLVMCYLSCKVLKFILSALILVAYAFLIGHEVVAFMLTYVFFFFAFLIFETRFFLWFETKLKNSKKVNNEKITVHSTVSASVDGDDGNADGARC
jgi:predicted membrane protein